MRKYVCENEKANWMNERQRGKRHRRQGRARGEEQMARGNQRTVEKPGKASRRSVGEKPRQSASPCKFKSTASGRC